MNRYPRWRYLALIIVAVIGLVYALPNWFGEDPAIQLASARTNVALTPQDMATVASGLQTAHITPRAINFADQKILVKFSNLDDQAAAKSFLQQQYGNQYTVAMSLTPAAPGVLLALGAMPMRLGLDLRGGVDFLLQVDTGVVIQRHYEGAAHNVADMLRTQEIPYQSLLLAQNPRAVQITFRNSTDATNAKRLLSGFSSDFQWQQQGIQLTGALTPTAVLAIQQSTLEQTMATLKRRVNALGISEATVQQSGADRISVSLPGIQDPTQARSILGKTATLEFHLVDTEHDAMMAARAGVPPGDQLYSDQGRPILLKDLVVLTGESITDATSGFDQNGRPNVTIRMGGAGESQFYRVTGENIGQPLAVVYSEMKSLTVTAHGKTHVIYQSEKSVINVATIQGALGSPFEVSGLSSPEEAQNLAILLKAGALAAPVSILAEHTIGPSMGQQNIQQGMHSIEVGLLLVVIFMILYYHFFGVIADLSLLLNLIFLVAGLSFLGAVVTFPGIAAIVLNIGMAVDANVLIYERIREELRQGIPVQMAIHAGFEKAFVTIIDANVTTFIAAIALFSLGSGPIKGFAITLTLGLITSVICAVLYTRAMVNATYGGKRVQQLSIGIKTRLRQAAN